MQPAPIGTEVSFILRVYSDLRGDSSTPIPYAVCAITSSWNLSLTWNTQPSYDPTCYGYATPTPWNWSGFWLSGGGPNWYNQWQAQTLANNGVMLFPYATNNNFDTFYSTLYNNYGIDPYADARRPLLGLTFTPPAGMPNFKLPLPGGYKWLLTNEIGGYECKGEAPFPDIAHQDAGSFGNYYSIDISWNNNGGVYGQYNTPVLAADGGKVIEVGGGNNPGDLNGFYIVIDHDSDMDIRTGFSTRYLHLKQAAARKSGVILAVGNSVNRGDQIGIVGTTGKYADGTPTSTAEHLHFGVRYQNQGYSYVSQLSYVVMDGWLLKSFQTECAVSGNGVPTNRIRYYNSTNTPTGN